MLKTLITTVALTLFVGLLLAVGRAEAAVRCEVQYGGREVCVQVVLDIDKKVCNPAGGSCLPASEGFSGRLVDNLGADDHRFSPGEEVVFRLFIRNLGQTNFSKVTVTDTLPAQLELTGGQLNFEITDLSAEETEVRDIKARVVSSEKLPAANLISVVNVAKAEGNGQEGQDQAQIFIEKKAVPAEKLPEAGGEGLALGLTSLFLGGYGLYLLRFSKKYI